MRVKFYHSLYIQVLIAIILGIIVGYFYPGMSSYLKTLAFLFVNAIKMMITPIIFLSLVSGITHVRNIRVMSKIGGYSLIYFIGMTFIALLIGLIVANLLVPGQDVHVKLTDFNAHDVENYTGRNLESLSLSHFMLNLFPNTFVSAFVDGEILQVLLVAILFSIALLQLEERAEPIISGINLLMEVFFKIIAIIVRFAPIGAFAAMGFTIAQYGIATLMPMLYLLICFYLTCLGFIIIGLGLVLKLYCNLNIFRLIASIKEEIFIVLGTSSSESVLPMLLNKLEHLGCNRSIVSLVLPLGYSFNLDGTCIYLTLAALYIAQALHVDLSMSQQFSLLGIMLITSKGAAGITGSGFIILAATLSMIGHIPTESVVLILGIDRFMSEGRAITNMLGNCVATFVISKWQKQYTPCAIVT